METRSAVIVVNILSVTKNKNNKPGLILDSRWANKDFNQDRINFDDWNVRKIT